MRQKSGQSKEPAEKVIKEIRRRKRKTQRFKSPGSAQRVLSIHAATQSTFRHRRHLLQRSIYKER